MIWILLILSVLSKESYFRLSRILGAHPTDKGVALMESNEIQTMRMKQIGPIKFSKKYNRLQPLIIQDSHSFNSIDDKRVPDPTDKTTVKNFASMTENAYFEPTDSSWTPIEHWNVTARFGFEGGAIRGYVFEDDQDNLVIVIKGTSLATPLGSGPTGKLDKLNDNLMFSCCCAKSGWEWTPICTCPISGTECSKSCILKESSFDGSYYNLAQTIYLAVKEWYPKHTNIWLAGHSLGGALASLVALTNGVPAFAYEAPGDLLYASRIGLLPNFNSVNEMDNFLDGLDIYHYGNTGDPIYLGQCTGPTSSCYVTYAN